MNNASSLPDDTRSEQSVGPWLKFKGFRSNPFERWNAETDEDLSSYYVDLGEFDLLQHLTEPCVVLARQGCGKTAQRQMWANHYRPLASGTKWLAVHYTYAGFEHVLRSVDYEITRVQARHHVEAILRQALIALQGEAQRDDKIHRALSAPHTAAQWTAYTACFAPHLNSASRPDNTYNLDALTSPELLAGFARLLRAAGLETCAILVDGVDEFLYTAGNASRMVGFLAPLLGTLALIEQPGLAFKFFLPQWLEHDLLAQDWFRQDRIRIKRIKWTERQIEEMISARLVHASLQDPPCEDLAQLCDAELKDKINDEVTELARGSPRTALRLASRLLRAHCRQIEPQVLEDADGSATEDSSKHVALFALETWEQVKQAWNEEQGNHGLRVDEPQAKVYLDQYDITEELNPQEYQVLASLYRHRHEVCDKETLIKEAWGGGIASEAMITQSIARLRRALEEYVPDAEYVETVRGVGYRLHSDGRPKPG